MKIYLKRLVIHRLSVDHKAQGGRIARKLVEYVEDFAMKNEYEKVNFIAMRKILSK